MGAEPPNPRPLVPPRPGAAADPRSIRAANAVQQLKKLAPPVEPPRGRARQRTPTLDEDGDATDVELKVGAIHERAQAQRGEPRGLPGIVIDADDESNEEVPTLVQQRDAKLKALRAELAQKHPPKGGPGGIADEDSDGRVTEVKKGEQGRAVADSDSELPTAPHPLDRTRPVTMGSAPKPPAAPDLADDPTPIKPQPAKGGMRQVIPPSPDIPPRPFATGPSVRANPEKPTTARPPPPPPREPPRE
jgi:hypothetical protein